MPGGGLRGSEVAWTDRAIPPRLWLGVPGQAHIHNCARAHFNTLLNPASAGLLALCVCSLAPRLRLLRPNPPCP